MTREEALKIVRNIYQTDTEKEALATLIPELTESEDERIRNKIIDYLSNELHNVKQLTPLTNEFEAWLAYLEKQKEKKRIITANLLEDGITGVQRELIEFLANNIDASWVDIIKSADAYAQRIKSMFEKQKEQKPAEWSERDERILTSAMSHIEDSQCFDHFHDISKEDIYTWLKSLRPRPHWKPSEEQMVALKETAAWKRYSNPQLFSLYEDLKKLMEE